jgi:uncharacterized protein YaaN involved in tellurite resistance
MPDTQNSATLTGATPVLTLSDDAPVAPSLTLDIEEPKQAEPQPAPQPQAKILDDSSLSEDEKKQVADFSEKIDLTNSTQVLQYGASSQKKVADFSSAALETIRTKDLGEVGNMITDLVGELKGFDPNEETKGFFGFFKKSSVQLDSLKTKYNKVETNVDKIEGMLQDHQVVLLKDIAMLDKMYEMNQVYFKELTMYVLAGKKKLAETRETQLKALVEKAKASSLPEDAQAAKDLADLCDRFEKKLYDLELTRNVSVQMSPQIRLIQSNDTMMAEKIQTSIVNTIPLWKSQMVLALGLAHSQQAIDGQRAVTDMTNELLQKNAAALKQGTIQAAQESERGIVDIETLTQTNQSLIDTLDAVVKIQTEGRAKRAAAEVELGRIESQLKDKLVSMAQTNI